MEIIHRISFNGDTKANFFKEVNRIGMLLTISPLPGHDVGLVTFEIAESDPHWESIQKMVDSYGAANLIRTAFSPEEIANSEWNRLVPIYEWGYPQPEKNMKWVELTYKGGCPKCGVGYKQKAQFLLAKDPRLGRNNFFTLLWTYTLFCKQEVVEVLKNNNINGYEVWDAIIRPTHQPSQVVSQLFVPEVSAPGLFDGDKNNSEKCTVCGIIKYAHQRRGRLKYRKEALHKVDIQLTYEWFGSGGYDGFHEFIISNRFSRLILSKGWRGVTLKPIELI